jgi:hypothetical protein
MSNTSLYRHLLTRPLTPEEREFVASCLARSEQLDALSQSLPGQLLASRSRREGREIKLTKSQLGTIRSFERDSAEAEAYLLDAISKVPSIHQVLQQALYGERCDQKGLEVIYGAVQPDEALLAKPLMDLRATAIAEIEEFLSKSKS